MFNLSDQTCKKIIGVSFTNKRVIVHMNIIIEKIY